MKFLHTADWQMGMRAESVGKMADLRFLRKRAASNRKFSSLEMDVIPLVDQEGDRA